MKKFMLLILLTGCTAQQKNECINLNLGELSKETGKPFVNIQYPAKEGEDVMLNVNASMLFWIVGQGEKQTKSEK